MDIIVNNMSTVGSPSDLYVKMEMNWDLPNTLIGGESAMKLAGRKYLPQEPMENDKQYQNRLNRTTLKNFYSWAVENHTGRVFNKPIVLSDDTPEPIVEYNKNVDLMGNNLDSFYREVFRDMLIKGISYVYVDYPRTMGDLSLAEELDSSLRPYCVHIKGEQVINAVPAVINGRVVLKRIHIAEAVEIPHGEWGTRTVEQIRVLYPGRWELYQTNDNHAWQIVDSGETKLPYIPVVPIYGKKIGFYAGESPLQNLANLNRAHWQSMSDQMNITHVARVPILYGTGFNDNDQLTVGSNSAILGPPSSTLEYIEHTGKAIEAGISEIHDLEDRMYIESLEMVSKSSDTATSRSLDVSDANSSLQVLAIKLQEMITNVNFMMEDWEDIPREGRALINTDFGLHIKDGSEANILLKMRQNGSISRETLHKEYVRRNILSEDFDSEEELKRLEAELKLKLNAEPYRDENGRQVVGDENALDLDTGKPRVE
jgi:hypothetical protein